MPYNQRSSRGTGMGLAVGRHIVREHGGILTVNSVVGEGATFTIMLPSCSKEGVRTESLSDAALP
ncbi:MAG: hypothetical protein R3C68_05525 [Myxococcota bacterium]